ncbi:MAG: hypothetical protein ACI4V3_04090 [Faecousia sp.]
MTTKKNESAQEALANAMEETVRIRLPKTKELQDDVFVSVNNRTWLIQRGVYVDVPACVAEVLQHAEEMTEEALRFDAAVGASE